MSLPSTNLTAQDLQYLSVSGVYGQVEKYSLQSLVELVYVKQGNDLIANAMNRLDIALQAAQGALSVLTDIQTLHNKIAIPSSLSFSATFPFVFSLDNQTFSVDVWNIQSTVEVPVNVPAVFFPTFIPAHTSSYFSTHNTVVFREPTNLGSGFVVTGPSGHTFTVSNRDQYRSVYNALASAYYVPIDPMVVGNMSAMAGYLTQMNTAKTRLASFMSTLRSTDGASALLGRLSAVYASLPAPTSSAFEKWVLDGNNLHGVAGVEKAGSIQKDLNVAITAAQSLNAAQNQSVRKFTFEFQQYMQSAAAILTALNQLFRSISGNISRT
jgi:hypothetical protein